MRRDLLRRLEKLEAHRPGLQVDGLFWRLGIVDPQALAPNDRIVEDWYLDSANQLRWTKERITTDPADQGWNYRHPDGQVILNIQRDRMVINDIRYYSALSISQGELSSDAKKAD